MFWVYVDCVFFQSAVTSSIYEEAGLSVQEKDSKSRPNLPKHNRTRITGGPKTVVRFLAVLRLKTTSDEKTQNIKVVALKIYKNFHVELFVIRGHLEGRNPHAFRQTSVVWMFGSRRNLFPLDRQISLWLQLLHMNSDSDDPKIKIDRFDETKPAYAEHFPI